METKFRAAAYCRYSSDNQRDESIDAQMRAIESYAKTKDISIVKIYVDKAKSATSDRRPEFQQMILDSEIQIFDVIIVHKLDRFSRDKYDSATYKRRLRKNGIKLLSVTEQLDGSPESIILESLLEGMAEYYSKNLAREVTKGLSENAYKCQHTGGRPPLGFNVDPESKKLVINESEAIIIKHIFSMYNDGFGYGVIIDSLNAKGYKTKLRATFGKNSLYEIVTNEKYCGVYIYNKKACKNSEGRYNAHLRKDSDDVIRIEGGCPAIVSKTDFNNAQKRIEENKRKAGSYKAKELYLLSGLIFCGSCGFAMQGNSRTGGITRESKYAGYKCGNKNNKHMCDNKEIKREHIESFILTELEKKLFNNIPLLVEKLNQYQKTKTSEASNEIRVLESALKDINNKISNIVNAVSNGLFQVSFKTEMSRLEDEKTNIEICIKEIQYKQPCIEITEELIRKIIASFKESVQEKNIIECKKFIKHYVEKVLVYPDRIEVTFRIISSMMEGSEGYTIKSGTTIKKVKKLSKSIA